MLDQWYQYTGWIKKNSTDAYAGAGTPTNPSLLPSVVSYIRPTFILNDSLGPAGNVMEIDQLCIDAFDEDGQNRLYLAIASAGTINTDKVIETSITNNAITTNKIAASSVVAGKISVAQLSALTTDIGSVTAGTVTGATVQTAASGARIELTSWSGLRVFDTTSPTPQCLVQIPIPVGAEGSCGARRSCTRRAGKGTSRSGTTRADHERRPKLGPGQLGMGIAFL